MYNWEEEFDEYLKASYQYYVTFEDTGMTDSRFDQLCRNLLEFFPEESDHPHFSLADQDLLKCGSGFSIQWPDELKIEFMGSKECPA